MIAAFLYGPLAQSVEQLAFNQLVPRSSRGRPTKKRVQLAEPFFVLAADILNPTSIRTRLLLESAH